MAHIFFNNPADLLTKNGEDALECILARKTKGIPKVWREKMDMPPGLPRVLPFAYIIRGVDMNTGQRLDLFPFPS